MTKPSPILHPQIAEDVPQIAKDVGFRQALSRLIDTHVLYAHMTEADPHLPARQAAAVAAWNGVCATAEAFLLTKNLAQNNLAQNQTAENWTAENQAADNQAAEDAADTASPEVTAPPEVASTADEQRAEEQRAEEQAAKERAAQEQEDADNLHMARFVDTLYPLARRYFKVKRSWDNPWYREKGVKKQNKAWDDLIDHLLSLHDADGRNMTWIDRFEGVHWREKEQRRKEKKKEKKVRRKDEEPREPKQGPRERRNVASEQAPGIKV